MLVSMREKECQLANREPARIRGRVSRRRKGGSRGGDYDSPAGSVDVRLPVKRVALLADPIQARELRLVVDTKAAETGEAALEDPLGLYGTWRAAAATAAARPLLTGRRRGRANGRRRAGQTTVGRQQQQQQQ